MQTEPLWIAAAVLLQARCLTCSPTTYLLPT